MATRELFETLKRLLKRRGMTYQALGEAIGLSESGVKKMFAARNCSVERLAQMADVLSIPLSELIRLSESPGLEQIALSTAQQVWLLEHPECFAFYWLLAIEGVSLARARARLSIDAGMARLYLASLDDLGLVRVEPGDRLVIPHGDMIRWLDEGPLLDHLNRAWSQTLVEDALAAGGTPRVFRLHHLALRPESAQELQRALETLATEFVRRARYEQATSPEAVLVQARLLIAAARGGFV